jgi:hypothetical protein
MHNIRGLAMEPRDIGSTEFFDTKGISLATSRTAPAWSKTGQESDSGRFVCRYPCLNCEKLLPLFGIKAQRTGDPPQSQYDKDMIAADLHAR